MLICRSKNRDAFMIISLFSEGKDEKLIILDHDMSRRLIVSADILLDTLISPCVYRSWESLSEFLNIDLSVLDLIYLLEDRISEREHCQSLTKKIIIRSFETIKKSVLDEVLDFFSFRSDDGFFSVDRLSRFDIPLCRSNGKF